MPDIYTYANIRKGKHWDSEENARLARVFVYISNDSILGTDQTGKRFYCAVYSTFAERGREQFASNTMLV